MRGGFAPWDLGMGSRSGFQGQTLECTVAPTFVVIVILDTMPKVGGQAYASVAFVHSLGKATEEEAYPIPRGPTTP